MAIIPDRDAAKGPLDLTEYAKYRFQYFPSEYMRVLDTLAFERTKPIRVLDIGCGPGNWTIAAANYNKNAEVVGIDPDDKSLRVAELYKEKLQCKNVSFRRLSYRDIERLFTPESFDYVLSMSVFMFFDEEHYFRTVSKILRTDGKLLMFWTHGIGYYFEEMCVLLRKKRLKPIYSSIYPVVIGLATEKILGGDHEHPVSYRRTKKVAASYGIDLELVGYTQLCTKYYNRNFHVLPIIFNIIGRKTLR